MDSNKLFLLILGIISGLLIVKKTKKVSGFLILVTIAIGYSITKDWIVSLSMALILGNIFVSLNNTPLSIPAEEIYIPEVPVEGFKSKKTKKKRKEKFSNKKDDFVDNMKENYENTDSAENEEENEEFFLDTKGSFMENYKSLTPKQVKGLNKDTQNLIKTQRELIETLKNMGPALKDGKEILDTFKNYFGDDQDMNKMLSNFKA